MQLNRGRVTLVNGSTTVDAMNPLIDWSTVKAGMLFIVDGDDVFYKVQQIALPGDNVIGSTGPGPRIIIDRPYEGADAINKPFAIVMDYTTKLGLPLMFDGDRDTPAIFSQAMRILDTAGGSGGGSGQPAYTFTTQAITIPAVGATVTATVVDASWIAIGEMVYIDSAGGTGMAGVLQVVTKVGNTLTLLNPLPPSGLMMFGEIPGGLINGVNTDYTSAHAFYPASIAVFLNGLRQRRVNDYSEINTQSFRLVSAPLPGDSLSIDYLRP
jgi:hypothetical protein